MICKCAAIFFHKCKNVSILHMRLCPPQNKDGIYRQYMPLGDCSKSICKGILKEMNMLETHHVKLKGFNLYWYNCYSELFTNSTKFLVYWRGGEIILRASVLSDRYSLYFPQKALVSLITLKHHLYHKPCCWFGYGVTSQQERYLWAPYNQQQGACNIDRKPHQLGPYFFYQVFPLPPSLKLLKA